jgi:hypothetical protein
VKGNHIQLRTRILILSFLMWAAVAWTQVQPPAPGNARPAQNSPAEASTAPNAPGQDSGASAAKSAQHKSDEEKALERREQSQRLLGVVPQFAVTSRRQASPLTSGEKFHLFTKSAFDPVEFGLVGLQAGASQAEDEFPGYGQGTQGYAKRYGASLADEVSSAFWSDYFWASLLKQDPRYFRMGQGPFMRRLGYALVQAFTCRNDNGHRTFNFANSLGALTSGGVSNTYYPQSDRGFGLTMSRTGIALMYGTLGGIPDEFWPDVRAKLHRRHKTPAVSATP